MTEPAFVTLTAADGTRLATVDTSDFLGARSTRVVDVHGEPVTVAQALVSRSRGHRLSTTDETLARSLAAHGALPRRDARLMVRRLDEPLPEPSPDVSVGPIGTTATRLVDAYVHAYPATHPDHLPGESDPAIARTTLASYLRGEVVGPYMADASLRTPAHGSRADGAIIVSMMPGDAEYEGSPWVTELFVHPDHHGRGLGRALLVASMRALAAAGHHQLGLAVTVGNPAERLYRSLGFTERSRTWTFTVPE